MVDFKVAYEIVDVHDEWIDREQLDRVAVHTFVAGQEFLMAAL